MSNVEILARHLPQLLRKSASLLQPPNAAVMGRNALSLTLGQPWLDYVDRQGLELDGLADAALGWLCHAQDAVGTGGVGCFEFYDWTTGYPEVTGYIIPTFWDAHRAFGRDDLADRALRMADWELRIQQPSGAWEGGYEGDGQPPVVFNTGQVIRGLLRTHAETGEQRHLDAAVRAGEWIVANQEPDGSWAKANFKGMRRVYDSYVAAPLASLGSATGDARFTDAAIRSCEFVLGHQHENGWFELCDNSPYFNDAPITHTICYTADGLIETGELVRDERFVDAGRRAADALMHRAEIWPRLYGRLDADWKPTVRFVCLTGAAQLGIILMRLHARSGDPRYLNASLKLVDFLAYVQRLNGVGRDRRGAIAGSYPIWGLYCPLKYPSWATKYFIDLLLLVRAAIGEEPA